MLLFLLSGSNHILVDRRASSIEHIMFVTIDAILYKEFLATSTFSTTRLLLSQFLSSNQLGNIIKLGVIQSGNQKINTV